MSSYDWKKDSIYGDILNNLSESFKWAGYDDGDCSGGGVSVWAPDVIYNSEYEWKDGSKGAYMIYYCASSTWRRSCIGYAVSKNAQGPFEYVDTVIYSGFTKTGATDGKSTRNTKWNNDYLNLNELIENKEIEGISDNWFDNEGGLFILELDEKTGDVIYPEKDSKDASGNTVDRYFGTHIAGGNHQSGEGPYIKYDKSTGYYYMYETYGGLTATGGYNMRLFRSKNVMGPYVDASVPTNTNGDLKLIKEAKGATISWKSSNTKVISNDGKVTRQDDDITVTLTATIKAQDVTKTFDYKVTVNGSSKVIYAYDFEKATNDKTISGYT